MVLSKEDKVKIARAAAKGCRATELAPSVGFAHCVPFDELVNEGYIRISSDDPKRAYWQARMYMYQLIHRGGVGTRVEVRDGSINHDRREKRVVDELTIDDLIDIKDAIDKLSPDEQLLIEERFVRDLTFQQIAPLHGKKHSTSIKFQIDKILTKLKIMLSK